MFLYFQKESIQKPIKPLKYQFKRCDVISHKSKCVFRYFVLGKTLLEDALLR